jgi:predicted ABC-type exoprotein transport system permease subunit
MFHKVVFTIHCTGWKSHIKKEINYKQRSEQKRALFTDEIKGIAPESLVS